MDKDIIIKKLLIPLITHDDLAEVLGKTLEFFRTELKFNSGAFFLFNPSFERLKLESQFGFSPIFLNTFLSGNYESSRFCDFSFFSCEDFCVYENLDLKDIVRTYNDSDNIKYKVIIIVLKDRKIKKGYLCLIKQEPYTIDDELKELLLELSDIISLKIQRSQIHFEMLRTVEQLEKLLNIQNAFLMDLDIVSIYKRILVEVSNMFNPSLAKLVRYEKGKFIVLNNDGEEIEVLNNNEKYGCYYNILHNFKDVRDIKIIENIEFQKINNEFDLPKDLKSYALLPIFVENKCNGFLFIGKDLVNHFQKEDFPLYVAFSIFASQAINLSQLHTSILALQEHLLKAQKMESIGILAGGIAHDFNNALAGVIGSADLIELELRANPKIMKYLKLIRDSAKRMSNWTNQLIAYARGGNYIIEPVDLNKVLLDTIGMLYPNFSDKICFIYSFDPNIQSIEADYNQMNQVITNLIMNSYESINEFGFISISTKNVPFDRLYYEQKQLDPRNTYIILSISDNGCGIEEQLLEKVFEPFVTTKFQGRGLGLSAVYGIVENHKGKIFIDSKLNVGTTVEVFIPTKDFSIDDIKHYNSSTKILFFNNDETSHQLLINELAPKGYNIYETSNIEYDIHSNNWDLLVIDTSCFTSENIESAISRLIDSKTFSKIIILFNTEENNLFEKFIGIEGIKLLPKPIDNHFFIKYIQDYLSK